MGTKVLVIGLDGATPELIERWSADGKLPHLTDMMRHGVYGRLKSTYPPISPAAWATFATGHNPGKHGIYDFRNYDPSRYSCYSDSIVDSSAIAGRTIWDLVGESGQRVGVITVPITYPAWEVNGLMVSGYPTPDAAKSFAYPAELCQSIPPLTEDSAFFKGASPSAVLGELIRLTHLRTDVTIGELTQGDFGLFVMVIGATDRAHHDWWKYIDPRHPAYDKEEAQRYGDYVLQVYQAADACVGRLLDVAGSDTYVIVMSDHGGTAHPKYYFNTNYWLRTLDLLAPVPTTSQGASRIRSASKQFYRTRIRRLPSLERIYRKLPKGLKTLATNLDAQAVMNLDAIDWKRTKAYRFPMYPPVEGIMINVAGRQPQGCVQTGSEYEDLRTFILQELRQVREPGTGEPIIVEAFRREELYHGDRLETAPDIIVVIQDAYKGGTSIDDLVTHVPMDVLSKLSGVHCMDGIILSQGPHVRQDATIHGAHIVDVAPTVLYMLGLPVPADMDGRVPAGLFDEGYLESTGVPHAAARENRERPIQQYGYSEEEEESVRAKLQGLGYL